jgi:hypothetical protein
MASSYSTNLAVELQANGENSGTWGTIANKDLGLLLEQAIASYVVQDFDTDADVTLAMTNGLDGNSNAVQPIYSPGTAALPVSARNMYIECTGAITGAKNLIVPANKKMYVIFNNTTGGYAITVKVSGQTGVSVPYLYKKLLVSNGTDIISALLENSAPTRQVFLTGTAATYTTPSGCRRIVVREKGGGGGSAGSASSANDATAGGNGGTTIFNSINANGGTGSPKGTHALGTSGMGVAGGTGGTGTASVRIAGAPSGGAQVQWASSTECYLSGGMGGGAGGGVGGIGAAAGTAGIANSGGGGGGASSPVAVFASLSVLGVSPGGGEGEYVEYAVTTPAATYTYTVGSGGTAGAAGTSGAAGTAGGSGYIIVDEYY